MPAYNFKKEFADKIRRGEKHQTIRRVRKRKTKIGDTLYLYTGMRTKTCELIHNEKCKYIQRIIIENGCIKTLRRTMIVGTIEAEKFARLDGFDSALQMIFWFRETYGLPFHGEIIYW